MYNHISKSHREVVAFWRKVWTAVVVISVVSIGVNMVMFLNGLF